MSESALFGQARCVGCGCTDGCACWDDRLDEPCHWLRVDYEQGVGLCSCCFALVGAWDDGDYAPRRVQIGPTDI